MAEIQILGSSGSFAQVAYAVVEIIVFDIEVLKNCQCLGHIEHPGGFILLGRNAQLLENMIRENLFPQPVGIVPAGSRAVEPEKKCQILFGYAIDSHRPCFLWETSVDGAFTGQIPDDYPATTFKHFPKLNIFV